MSKSKKDLETILQELNECEKEFMDLYDAIDFDIDSSNKQCNENDTN